MRTFRLFSQSALPQAGEFDLNSDASHYLLKVLRASLGLEFIMFDGNGDECLVKLIDATKKVATVDIISRHAGLADSPLYTHLGIGISKGDRMDMVMQKATELGVNRITPLFTDHGDVKLKGERLDKKHQHWFGVITSACEQCGRSSVPQLDMATSISEFISSNDCSARFILYPTSSRPLDTSENPKRVALLIGPEGGLSEEEISDSLTQGFTPLQLGPRVLRTETAPLAALSLVQHRWGDM